MAKPSTRRALLLGEAEARRGAAEELASRLGKSYSRIVAGDSSLGRARVLGIS